MDRVYEQIGMPVQAAAARHPSGVIRDRTIVIKLNPTVWRDTEAPESGKPDIFAVLQKQDPQTGITNGWKRPDSHVTSVTGLGKAWPILYF